MAGISSEAIAIDLYTAMGVSRDSCSRKGYIAAFVKKAALETHFPFTFTGLAWEFDDRFIFCRRYLLLASRLEIMHDLWKLGLSGVLLLGMRRRTALLRSHCVRDVVCFLG